MITTKANQAPLVLTGGTTTSTKARRRRATVRHRRDHAVGELEP